jgi:hypothetical protein
MALDTFDGLKSAITKWAMRDGDSGFVASLPDFIALCESRLNRILRTREMEAAVTLTPNVDGEVALPADYIAFRDVTLVGVAPQRSLQAVSPDYSVNAFPFDGAIPQFFSITGQTLRTHPKGSGDVRVRYWQKLPALSDATPTNWLLAKAPDAYLYGSLLEVAPFMMDDARVAVWGQYFDKAVEGLVNEDHQARYMRGQVRVEGSTP